MTQPVEAPAFCSSCGARAGAGPFCAGCGKPLLPAPPATPQTTRAPMSIADRSRMARRAQWVIVAGLIGGFLVGVVVAAYVLFPLGGTWAIVAVFLPFVSAFIGQRLALGYLDSWVE